MAGASLDFAERGKARSLLESLRVQRDLSPEIRKRAADFLAQASRARKVMELIARGIKEVDKLKQEILQGDTSSSENDSLKGGSPTMSKWQEQLANEQKKLEQNQAILPHEQAALEALKSSSGSFPALSTIYAPIISGDINLALLASSIPPNTLLVEYCTMTEGIAVFAISTDGLLSAEWTEMQDVDLQKYVSGFLRLMRPQNTAISNRNAMIRQNIEVLSKALIAPVERHFANTDNLVFVPSGCLFNFPFAVLEMGEEPTNQFTLVVISADSTCSAHGQSIICRYLSERFETYDQTEYKPE